MNKTSPQFMMPMQLKENDVALIKQLFSGNDEALYLIRKIFYPTLTIDSPVGNNTDLTLLLDTENVTPEQALINLKARNFTIQHIEKCLTRLYVLAGSKEETLEQTMSRLSGNSNK